MLKKFLLRNYKNFKDDISIDFGNIAGYQFSTDCITDGLISKMLIYGKNATGKTNLGRALMDIVYIIISYAGLRRMDEGIFLNADSVEEAAEFSYTFQFGDRELIYRYARFANFDLRDEELTIDQQTIYQCDFQHESYQFDHLQYIDAESINIERYRQSLLHDEEGAEETSENRIPFLRWLIGNAALKSDSLLLKMSDYVKGMVRMTVSQGMMRRTRWISDAFFESLEELEEFLNEMGIEYKLALRKLPDGQRELYFAHEKLVPFFENASSGTLALVELYRRFIVTGRNASFMYLDEFDAFYHHEMAENIIRFLKKKYPKCQIIMTTHNTNLMTNRLMRPDCLFILSTGGTLTALCNATMRELREGHNLEKMYISGEFEKYE
ncbi:MAG: ATP-binding protein [Eubacterium sp.]|nr:ATP-binding protein [Eubacterium sp.]